jgi:hypothetical protein
MSPVLEELTHWPLPEPLPPEALPWRDRLIRSWEQYRPTTTWRKTIRLGALVRLDRRVERLPEWLREARRALDLVPASPPGRAGGWRPRPGDGPPHGDKAEAAQAWVRFWEERYRTPGSELDGLIAAAALLHLAEAGWLPSGPSPERLREEVRQRVQQWKTACHDRSLSGWCWVLFRQVPPYRNNSGRRSPPGWNSPGKTSAGKKEKPSGTCLPPGSGKAFWNVRAWGGRLREPPLLLPLARALEWEEDGDVLLAMMRYVPEAAEVSAHPEAARAVVARWEALSRNDDWRIRQAAWVARWNFLRAGGLTAEEQTRFGADYMEAIGAEKSWDVLLTLAQITPPGMFPLATWAGRLSDQGDRRRLAAQLAIHDWLVDMAGGGQRRQMRQVLRRAGQEGAGNRPVAPFVNLPPEVWPDFRRLREIETALAAGHLPPSPDAGAGNRPIPRTVPARLPESHPRTGPPGITDRTTGRTAGSEPPARHPFPEVIRPTLFP